MNRVVVIRINKAGQAERDELRKVNTCTVTGLVERYLAAPRRVAPRREKPARKRKEETREIRPQEKTAVRSFLRRFGIKHTGDLFVYTRETGRGAELVEEYI